MGKIGLNLTQKRFGRLVAIKDTDKRSKWGPAIWLCRCDCGKSREVSSHNLRSGNTKSCGCLQREAASAVYKKIWNKSPIISSGKDHPNYKHGDAIRGKPVRLYNIWRNMKSRCSDKRRKDYKYYGGRGIRVYSKWQKSYGTFRQWALTNGYKLNLTIDRIDHNGNYHPANCRWISQSKNTKRKEGNRG